MVISRRRCPPEWPIKDGRFAPIQFNLRLRSAVLDRTLSLLEPMRFDTDCRVFLRGGILEECRPHPQADVDVVVVGKHKQSTVLAEAITQGLAALGRPVEAVPVEEVYLQRVVQLRMLIQFRSIQLHGPPLVLAPLEVNKGLIEALWRVYAPTLLSDTLDGHTRHRLVTLKYLLRAVGILGLFEGRYSRDLKTCLAWSRRYVPRSHEVLARAFEELERDVVSPISIRSVIIDLEGAFTSALLACRCHD